MGPQSTSANIYLYIRIRIMEYWGGGGGGQQLQVEVERVRQECRGVHVQNTEVERLRMWGTSMTCGCVTEEGVSGKKEHSMQYRSVEKEEKI